MPDQDELSEQGLDIQLEELLNDQREYNEMVGAILTVSASMYDIIVEVKELGRKPIPSALQQKVATLLMGTDPRAFQAIKGAIQ